MIKINFKNQKGFTMVETLVAVAILMISIAGPLVIAQKGLMGAIYARDQVTASFLAQDVMEYIKNLRDENVLLTPSDLTHWKDGFDQCLEDSTCAVDTVDESITQPSNKVLYHGVSGYRPSSSSGESESQFSREFYIVPNAINPDNEVTAIVKVSWQNGTVANEVVLKNELFKIGR